ncbi:MAG TPA: pyridoxal-phosphate dependent enzyme [Anaerolineaceae bacterium]|nr:pyridoxal-phosphate dependent enzyme [Anaerolineaceae bacterium]HQP08043.1 pyridoxal-phosphate dependent enzyme [Anaerolineaceae bacterium]
MTHPDTRISVTIDDIQTASQRINPYILHTPLIPSRFLSEKCAVPVFLKLECLQPTGSFKIRGATNRLLQLSPEEKQRGVITVSSGNHGRALAYTAARLGIPATIFLSVHTPINKVEAIRKTGAVTMMTGDCYDEAEAAAADYERIHNLVHIPSFDNLQIIAGQGTIALEIFEDAPATRHIIFPLSGGGMGSGIGIVARNQNPPASIWGVSMERAPVMVRSLEAGKVLILPEEETLADGLKGGLGITNQYTFFLCQQLVDHTALVSEEEIGKAIVFLYKEHHLIVEGSGAVGVAALLSGKVVLDGPATVVISGSNIDLPVLMRLVKEYSGLF